MPRRSRAERTFRDIVWFIAVMLGCAAMVAGIVQFANERSGTPTPAPGCATGEPKFGADECVPRRP